MALGMSYQMRLGIVLVHVVTWVQLADSAAQSHVVDGAGDGGEHNEQKVLSPQLVGSSGLEGEVYRLGELAKLSRGGASSSISSSDNNNNNNHNTPCNSRVTEAQGASGFCMSRTCREDRHALIM